MGFRPPKTTLRTSLVDHMKRRIKAPTLTPNNPTLPDHSIRDFAKFSPYDLSGNNGPLTIKTPRAKKNVF